MDPLRRPSRAAVVAACLSLAAVSVTLALTAGAAGSTPPSSYKVQVDSVGCVETSSAPGHVAHGYCIYLLTDGRRFKCPVSFANHPQTPGSLVRSGACHRLRPLPIPAGWKRVFARLDAVQSCLERHGVTANGGPYLEGPRPRKTPIGELILSEARPTAFVGFYTNTRVARRAEPGVIKAVARTGGEVERRGSVTVAWLKPPSPQLRATTQACAFS